MAINPTPARQRVLTFVTPKVGDLLFYEAKNDAKRADPPPYGTTHPDTTRFPNHKFVFARAADEQGLVFHWFYAAEREGQDEYNFEFGNTSVGGLTLDAVTRTYVYLREDFNPEAPVKGTAMPDIPAGMFSGYVFFDKEQRRIGDKELDSLFVVEQHVYVKRCSFKQIGVDPLNGKNLVATESVHFETEILTGSSTAAALFADPTNAFWGLQTNGTQREGRQLTCDWYWVRLETVVAGTVTDGVVAVGAHTSNDNYYWPPVLETFELLDWERLDGGVDIYPALRFHPEGYNGPCLNTITRTWSKEPFVIPVVELMQPTRIYYASPYFTMNVSECLHGAVAVQCDIGNSDPVYDENVGSTRYFAATNYTTWPATIVAYDDQEPFRGGYLRTRRVITRPAIPANVNWTTGAPI